MNGLDQIPWKDLTHAYGSAADVPELLRSLRTASPDLQAEESPLWQLFGNIWHQGTVYEATAYAVPFLIELAVDQSTPDRIGILSLLAEIAKGSSYRDVHGNLLHECDWEEKKQQELLWVMHAHDAVSAGFEHFVNLTVEPGDVAYASAHVLARLPVRLHECAAIVRRLLRDEQRASYRAGLLLLIGSIPDDSQETLTVLGEAVDAKDVVERHAAAYAIARLQVRPPPIRAREAIIEAIAGEELETGLQDLPWDATSGLDPNELFAYLDDVGQGQVVDGLLTSVESGEATTNHVGILVNLLFPPSSSGRTPMVTAKTMTMRQFRAVRALYQSMKGGKRIFYGHFPCWGLPDTMREWRELASGREPTPVDHDLPLLADGRNAQKSVSPSRLQIGQEVIHRHFGRGKVIELMLGHPFTEMTVQFDEEGTKQLSLPTDGSPL